MTISTALISNITHYMNLQNTKFLIKFKPFNDELLSSWLIRIARAHRTIPTSFTNMHFKNMYAKNIIWQRDLDIWAPKQLIEEISYKSNISYETLFNCTLKSYSGVLVEKITGKTKTPFVQSLGNYCHIKRNGGLRFCPHCLNEDKEPYFRKYWRLSFYTACTKHNVFLQDRCPKCKTPLTLSKSYKNMDFTHCYKCGFDFRQSIIEQIPACSFGLDAIKTLMDVLSKGYMEREHGRIDSLEIFRILQILNRKIYLNRQRDGALDHEVMSFKHTLLDVKENQRQSYENYISIKEQYLLYSASLYKLITKVNNV